MTASRGCPLGFLQNYTLIFNGKGSRRVFHCPLIFSPEAGQPATHRPSPIVPHRRPSRSTHRPSSPTSRPSKRPSSPTGRSAKRPSSPTRRPAKRPSSPTSPPARSDRNRRPADRTPDSIFTIHYSLTHSPDGAGISVTPG